MKAPEQEADDIPIEAPVQQNVGTLFTDSEVSKLTIKDLRTELRSRGYNPAGGKEALIERLIEAIGSQKAGGDLPDNIDNHIPFVPSSPQGPAGMNNYSRPEGQNVDNFITDRSSSRVLAPPGGVSTVSFG
eukprot:CAMPEP_0196598122 /NCGR_PEP_ID=MMETSP1081-20130531/94134_1 /TAXON_ID=36882 /ORGANISM="Pyramimonas amylifera, Strain CCMP720" /LENGTH=130 /DNA_ID=CAMNT_0041923769 /DNA_START=240 /DNA_END=632 /DNA_ORIENTATION=+